jgi:uncharacterized membrane protein
MMNFFISLVIILIWPISYFVMRNNLKPKNNIILGATLPLSAHNDCETQAICNSFKKSLNIVMLPLLLLAIPLFFMQSMGAVMTWGMTWVLFIIVVPFVVFAKHRGKLLALKNAKNWHSTTEDFYLDEDEHWLWGILYHNPNDERFLVNSRVGMNMTVNMAKPAGKAIMIFSFLCILALPLIGVWIWYEDVTPTRLVLSERTLVARHTRDQYVIQLDTIESVELIESLPTMLRVGGIGLHNLSKGNFRAGHYGMSSVNIHPGNPPFLVIHSAGRYYILNDSDSNVTRDVYALIKW